MQTRGDRRRARGLQRPRRAVRRQPRHELRQVVQQRLRAARGRARRTGAGRHQRAVRLQRAAIALQRGGDRDRRPARVHDPRRPRRRRPRGRRVARSVRARSSRRRSRWRRSRRRSPTRASARRPRSSRDPELAGDYPDVEVVSPEIAKQVKEMMVEVVNEGTGSSAALPDVQVAGKTGTAELGTLTDDQPTDPEADPGTRSTPGSRRSRRPTSRRSPWPSWWSRRTATAARSRRRSRSRSWTLPCRSSWILLALAGTPDASGDWSAISRRERRRSAPRRCRPAPRARRRCRWGSRRAPRSSESTAPLAIRFHQPPPDPGQPERRAPCRGRSRRGRRSPTALTGLSMTAIAPAPARISAGRVTPERAAGCGRSVVSELRGRARSRRDRWGPARPASEAGSRSPLRRAGRPARSPRSGRWPPASRVPGTCSSGRIGVPATRVKSFSISSW